MRNGKFIAFLVALLIVLLLFGCKLPKPEVKTSKPRAKSNYIILLDLSDRLIVQDNQPERDKQIIKDLYSLFEQRVKKDLYIKSRDEIKVVARQADHKGFVFTVRAAGKKRSLHKVAR
jgi:hypothetical protein